MNVIQEINYVNDKFATQGSKLKIEKRGDKLNIRGSLPSKEDNNNFKIQRISLGLKADISGLEEAKKKLRDSDIDFKKIPMRCIRSWFSQSGYLKSMVELISEQILNCESPQNAHIFFYCTWSSKKLC